MALAVTLVSAPGPPPATALPPAAAAVHREGGSPAGSNALARVVDEVRATPRQLDLTVSTPSLAEPGKVRLLTPIGWDTRRAGDRWPVLYLLAGGDDTTPHHPGVDPAVPPGR